MKQKIFLLLCMAMFTNIMSKAQVFHGGLRTGLQFNQLNALGWQNNYQTSPFFGMYANVGNKRIALHVEANYTNQKSVTDTSFKGLYAQYMNNLIDSAKAGSFKFTKLQVPVMLNFKFNSKFWLQFGAVYTNAVSVVDVNNFVKTSNTIFKTNDIALSGGLWLNVTKKINVSARYSQSLSDINNLSSYSLTPPSINTNAWKNQYFQVGVGYRLF
jgi:hypothetical protein